MSHVDEGTLHAYLDGELPSSERAAVDAHLAHCATCRAMLAEEQALLERASALLGSARPVERPAPPFEQIRRAPRRSPWRVRTPVAWAASIVLALGLGYYLRDAGKTSAPAPVNEDRSLASSVPETVQVGMFQYGDKTRAAAPPSRQRLADAPRAAGVAKANEPASVDSLQRRDSNLVGFVTLQPQVSLRGAAPATPAPRADSLAARRGAPPRALVEGVVTAAPSQADQGRVGAAAARRAERQSVRELVATSWPVISRGAAASLLGDKPVGVPGLATRRIRRSPGSDSTVVVEQALDSSTVIQIFQRPAGDVVTVDGYAVSGGLERGRADRVLARYVGRLRVEISGPVSTDSLNRLLEQVEPLP